MQIICLRPNRVNIYPICENVLLASGVIVDATQEMMTLGLCNIFGSFIQAMPSCGAFTRSAVASSSGVRTPLQGIYSGDLSLMIFTEANPTL
jgi:sodium-independent sulfate anion transporter 11